MATDKPSAGFGTSNETATRASRTDGKATKWEDFIPKRVDSEDALGEEQSKAAWEKLYKDAGFVGANEDERKMVRFGVYVYCAKNGTSREGDYSGTIILSNGKRVEASVIARAAGKMRIRKFLRANMAESYAAFKQTRVMESDDRFVTRAASFGIAAENAFATADWMADCPDFTPAEMRAHEVSFTRGIDRAKRARGGRTLEDVEAGRIDANLDVQGPAFEHGSKSEF